MSIRTFNIMGLRMIDDIGLRTIVTMMWTSDAKEGIKAVQELLNSKGYHLKVDGWLGENTTSVLNTISTQTIIRDLNELIEPNADIPIHVTIAKAELGVKEIKGKRHNRRVLKYHSTTYGKYKTDEVPWCGSFVNWVLKEAGFSKTVKYPERAKAWREFGTEISTPVLGCLAVKSRKGGGHVCFVVGKSRSGKYIYCLGGNQGDAVSIRKYRTNAFTNFRRVGTEPMLRPPVYRNGRLAGREA